MTGETDQQYYERRGQQELDLAAAAVDPHVRKLHLNMAARYATKAELAGPSRSRLSLFKGEMKASAARRSAGTD